MRDKTSPATDGLSIAPFLVRAGTHTLGTVRQILRPSETLTGLKSQEFFVGSRKKGEVYVLPNGERLLVTDQACCPQPASIVGQNGPTSRLFINSTLFPQVPRGLKAQASAVVKPRKELFLIQGLSVFRNATQSVCWWQNS
jgi:hypothetical protein